MRPIKFFFLLSLCAAPVAWAQPSSPSYLLTGEDITAWTVLEQRHLSGSEAVEGYASYLQQFADSPFAEVALARLVDLGVLETLVADNTVKAAILRVRERYEAHQGALALDRAVWERPRRRRPSAAGPRS